jgi:GNAT superfamily N-acetyltransferase
MIIMPFEESDTDSLNALQPPDWQDITPHFQFYIRTRYCHPLKMLMDGKIVGVGAAIYHKDTAWLAHIIVHPAYRGKGIGTSITQALVNMSRSAGFNTILLIASAMGAPVYRKLGFTIVDEYLFFKGGQIPEVLNSSEHLIPFDTAYADQLVDLDRMASGEDRSALLELHLNEATLYFSENTLMGFCLPDLGEGLIVASCPEAGLALLNSIKVNERIVVPAENHDVIDFLIQNRFTQYQTGTRMCLGNEINWHPEMIYSRIGGNLG